MSTDTIKARALSFLWRLFWRPRSDEEQEPLAPEAATQLTRMLSIANGHFSIAIEAKIGRFLECRSDLEQMQRLPHELFCRPDIGRLLSDVLTRKKRDVKSASEDLVLLGVQIEEVEEHASFDTDLFSVEKTEDTVDRQFHDTVCRMLAPAFRYRDEFGHDQVKRGSIIAYLCDEATSEPQEDSGPAEAA